MKNKVIEGVGEGQGKLFRGLLPAAFGELVESEFPTAEREQKGDKMT